MLTPESQKYYYENGEKYALRNWRYLYKKEKEKEIADKLHLALFLTVKY